jgi:hypothetical protein
MGATILVWDAAQGAAALPGWRQASRCNTAMRTHQYRPEGLLNKDGACVVARLARTPVRAVPRA